MNRLVFELRLNWHFVKRDIFAVIFPGILFTLRALLSGKFGFLESLFALLLSVLYFWFVLLSFCISNQLYGIKEDMINKPDRPIPSKITTIKGAYLRFIIYTALGITLGIYLKIFLFVCIAYTCLFLHNFAGLGNNWFMKNLLVGFGMFSAVGAGWNMVMPMTSYEWRWISFIAGVWFFLAHIQDLRDMEGDRNTGRVTFPLYFGELFTRAFLSIGFFLLPSVIFVITILFHHTFTVALYLWIILFVVISWYIALRLLTIKNQEGDDKTYSIFLCLYCFLLISSSFLMY